MLRLKALCISSLFYFLSSNNIAFTRNRTVAKAELCISRLFIFLQFVHDNYNFFIKKEEEEKQEEGEEKEEVEEQEES